MAAKKTWPRQETLPESSEVKLPIPSEHPASERKVLFKENPESEHEAKVESEHELISPSEEFKGSETEIGKHEENVAHHPSDEEHHDHPEASMRFLKDVAESDEEGIVL